VLIFKEKSVAQKKQPELIVLLVMFLSIMLSASLICRALQWASEPQEE
jgi:hypothetical protein